MTVPSALAMTRILRAHLILWVVASLVLAFFISISLRVWPYVTDDTYISLRYAQNLVHGHGLVYNRGEHVEGYTNFLWTLALAIPLLLRLSPIPFAKLACDALALACAPLIFMLASESLSSPGVPRSNDSGTRPPRRDMDKHRAPTAGARRRDRGSAQHGTRSEPLRPTLKRGSQEWVALAAAPALVFLATPLVALSAAEGLETMLFTFLLLASLTLMLREQANTQVPASALACAALAMTRPDGVLFAPWLACIALAFHRPWSYVLRWSGVFLVLFGAYFAARWIYYGDPLPNTFYAKAGGDPRLWNRGWQSLGQFAADGGGLVWILAIPALLARRTRTFAIGLAGLVLLRVGFHLWSGGAWTGRFRFLVPVLPFIDVLVLVGVVVLIRNRFVRMVAVGVAAVLLVLPGWVGLPSVEQSFLGWAHGLQSAHVPLGLAIHSRTSPGAVIAMDDAGAGPYLSQRTNIDMLGLNDRHIGHLKGIFSQKFDVRYVLGRRPDLIVLLSAVPHPASDSDLLLPGHAAMFRDPEFTSRYAFAREYAYNPGYHLAVYRRIDSVAVPKDF